MWTWYDSQLIKIQKITSTTSRFWLQVPDLEQIDFKAGQFITMDLPIHAKRLKRWRSYSIADAPNGTNVIELCIVNLPGGLASDYLFNKVKLGDTIKFKGPAGVFCLPEKVEHNLVMICTGTGIAPFRSMVLDLIDKGKPYENIHLVFGTRFEENILYREEFEKLQAKNNKFKYTIALSRQEDWDGERGYVHQIYEKEYQTSENTHFYLCGWQNMIDEARERLAKMGVDKSLIFYELYG